MPHLMLLNKIRISLLLAAVFLVLGSASVTHAQEASKPFEARFWQFLIGNNYKQWAPAPGQDGDFFSGQVPHGALLKLYINRSAASNIAGLKIGSVVVLENYRTDRSLKSISVMYRTEGFNPSANDWYWVEYNPDGTVVKDESSESLGSGSMLASNASNKMMGKASRCINCHNQAGGSDFAFFNDLNSSNVAGGKKPETITLR